MNAPAAASNDCLDIHYSDFIIVESLFPLHSVRSFEVDISLLHASVGESAVRNAVLILIYQKSHNISRTSFAILDLDLH